VKTDSDEISKDTIVDQIKNQNQDIAQLIAQGEEFKVLFIKNDPSSSTCSAVVRVGCKICDVIKSNRNHIFIGISSCRVFDRFFVKRCNKCQEFGHYQDTCKNPIKCGYCGQNHASNTCPLKDLKDLTKLKCTNCAVKCLLATLLSGINAHPTFKPGGNCAPQYPTLITRRVPRTI